MTFFQRLAHETASERAYLMATPQIIDGLKGNISLATYLAYLQEAYHHVKHTVPLMEACKARLAPRQQWLIPALDEYVEEEKGHELWILEDIEGAERALACGVGGAEILLSGQREGLPHAVKELGEPIDALVHGAIALTLPSELAVRVLECAHHLAQHLGCL